MDSVTNEFTFFCSWLKWNSSWFLVNEIELSIQNPQKQVFFTSIYSAHQYMIDVFGVWKCETAAATVSTKE